jgi:hypothetical protein
MSQAYDNIDNLYRPPPCPDGTNIVFYTNYLYGRHCQVKKNKVINLMEFDHFTHRFAPRYMGESTMKLPLFGFAQNVLTPGTLTVIDPKYRPDLHVPQLAALRRKIPRQSFVQQVVPP